MDVMDLGRVRKLRSVVRWAADPRAFGLLRDMSGARWAVAEARGGELAGMVGAVPLGKTGILCHLAVHDGYRRMGLGTSLSRWAVCHLRSRGVGGIRLYSTPQAEKLYRSMGFAPANHRVVYRLEGGPRRVVTDGSGYAVETITDGDTPEIYGVDYWSYGADRSALILATLKLHPDQGLVARDAAGRIKGYLIRSATPDVTRIGPFMASGPGVARLLLAGALRGRGMPVEATVTGEADSPAHALFGEFGFAGRKDRLRMELGEASAARPGLESYATTPYLAT